ncbi:unnamed protein product [Ectocarpus sp. 12 AP-2014]
MRDTIGPWMWCAPAGMNLIVDEPQPVVIRDVDGQQEGANHWEGLREQMTHQLDGFWGKVSWHRHSCDLGRKAIVVNDGWRSIKAAVIVQECPLHLVNLRGQGQYLRLPFLC